MALSQPELQLITFIRKHTDKYKERAKIGGARRQLFLRAGRKLVDKDLVNYHDHGWYSFTEEGKALAARINS